MQPSRHMVTIAAALLAVGCGGTATVTETAPAGTVTGPTTTVTAPAETVTVTALTAAAAFGPPRQLAEFGHIRSLARHGAGYQLGFDPAILTTGATANAAAAQDGAVPPGQTVPNGNYAVDDGHRVLTYLVPADARVTVLTTGGSDGTRGTRITVAELARIVHGRSHLHLLEPISTGFWISIHVDTVHALAQEFVP